MKKKQKPAPVVLTTTNTGVAEIFDDLLKSLHNMDNMLTLFPPKLKKPDGK